MQKKFKFSFWILPLVLTMSISIAFAKKPQYTKMDVTNGGSLSGIVLFKGEVPPPVSVHLKNEKNSEFCLENANPNKNGELLIQHVEVKDGYLKDAVISIEDIKTGKRWVKDRMKIQFKNCQAFPKVGVIQKSPKRVTTNLVTIENHDAGVLHNPKGYSIGEKTRKIFFKKWLLNKGAKVDVTKSLKLLKKDRDFHFYVECEQHLWMSVSSKVVWNPYHDISKDDGSFKMNQIPPGHYKIVVWHPYVGEKTVEVDISSGTNTQLELTLP